MKKIRHMGTRKRRRCQPSQTLTFEKLENRQLLAGDIAFWDFGDATGTTFREAAIVGSQSSDLEWRSERAAIQTSGGNLNILDDGSNQFFTDLRQQSNPANLNPLDLSGRTHLRLHIDFQSWDLTNADEGTVQRLDLKRSVGDVHAHIRLRKTATGSEMFLGFNGATAKVTLGTGEASISVTLDLDLISNTAAYDVDGVVGNLVSTNNTLTLQNETLNFGVFSTFLGTTASTDTVSIDSMGLSLLPKVTRSIQSGSWTDPATWDNGLPDDCSQVIVNQGNTVTLDGAEHVTDSLIVHGILNVAEDGGSRTLSSSWIHVNSGGIFQVGSAANRFDNGQFNLILTGTDTTADHLIETTTGTIFVQDNDGFLMTASGGQLQFFGEERLSFTKLGVTAEVGSTVITVENVIERNFDGTTSANSDGELNWQAGDEIVIASSSRNYAHEEVRTITGINNLGTETELTLDSPMSFRHYGEIEVYDNGTRTWDLDLRAEVALLNRSVTIEGTQDTDFDFGDRANYGTGAGQSLGIGGHTMIMPGSGQITVDGVRFDKMGQTGNIGRYPIHWHLGGDRTGDVLRNSSITNSNNRGTTIHGTQGVLLEGNVYHDIHGHGIFLEDGVESDNQFLNNLALGIHQVGGDNSALGDPFIVDTHDVVFQDPTKEISSAAFWITNPDNTWVGNISAGSEGTGFWFIFPTQAIGASANNPEYDGLDPSAIELGTFLHNSSHTSPLGLVIDRGADIELEVGDPIFPGNGPGAGRYYPPSPLLMKQFTAYKHDGAAVYTNVDDGYTFDEFKYADNFQSSFQLRSKTNSNTLYVGHSRGNSDLNQFVSGHTLYNGNVILEDNHYAGFTGPNGYFFAVDFASKRQHYLVSGATFEDDGTAGQLRFGNPNGSGLFSSQLPVAGIDTDGSLTGHVGGGAGFTIIPDHPFHRDSDDFVPAGWEALVTEDYYAAFEFVSIYGLAGEIDNVRITNPVGISIDNFSGQNKLNAAVKLGWGDYQIEFPDGLGRFESEGFKYVLRMTQGDEFVPANQKANVFQFKGIAGKLAPAGVPRVSDLNALRAATETVYFDDAKGDLWMNIYYELNLDLFGNQMEMLPVATVEIDNVAINEGSPNRAGIGTITTTFDQAVWQAPTLRFYNHTTSQLIDASSMNFNVSGLGTNVLQWDILGNWLPDGRYTLEVLSSNPNAPVQTFATEFHVLRGDVSGNGRAYFEDTGVVRANVDSLLGSRFRSGDANGDGRVNFIDFRVVHGRYNLMPLGQLAFDWGDAPEAGTEYSTIKASNGAHHVLGSGLQLGTSATSESDGQPSSDANLDGADDGIIFGAIEVGLSATIDVNATVPATGFLNAWMDFNQDGDWLDEGEQIFVDQSLANGAQQLQFDVPIDALTGDAFARFRLSSSPGYSYIGLAADGEVEDYMVSVDEQSASRIAFTKRLPMLSLTTLQPFRHLPFGAPILRVSSPVMGGADVERIMADQWQRLDSSDNFLSSSQVIETVLPDASRSDLDSELRERDEFFERAPFPASFLSNRD